MSDHNELDAVRDLRQAVSQLPREIRPARDLWPGIEDRLAGNRQQPVTGGWWRLAAAVLVTATGLLLATGLAPEAPESRSRVAALEAGVGSQIGATHMRQRDGVLHAHNDLVEVIARRRGRLDAAGAAALAMGLADLERATAEIETALIENPNGRRLRLALAAAYRRESDWTSRLGHV